MAASSNNTGHTNNADSPALAPSSLEGCTLQGVYEVEEKIAHGGMAWVYRARHARFGSPWALKILFPHHAENPEVRDRFMRESYIQHQLTHPNVVRVHDLIEERGICGYVMEWCGEGDLRQLLFHYRGPLPLGQAAFAFDRIVSGVWYAHKRGIVHRDLKPENILLSSQGDQIVPRITDFGIAKVLEEAGHTETGAAIGTFSYMSPEQFLDSKHIDERSDIYALGVILYLITTGRLPFHFKKGSKSNFLGMMLKVQHEPPPPPDELPAPLRAVILRCLEKEPGARYANCGVLGEAFNAACEASGIAFAPLEVPSSSGALQTKGHDALSITPSPVSSGIQTGELSLDHTPLPTPDLLGKEQPGGPETQDNLLASAAVPELRGDASSATPSSLVVYWKIYAVMAVACVGILVGAYWLLRGPVPGTPQALPRDPVVRDDPNTRKRELRPLPSPPEDAVPIKPKDRPTPQQTAQLQASFLRLRALLERGQWRPALILYRDLVRQRLKPVAVVRLLSAMATTFPLNVEARLKRLLQNANPRGDARRRCLALHKELVTKTASARRSIRQVRAQVQRQLQKVGDFSPVSRTLLGLVQRYPTATSLRILGQQTRDALAKSIGTWPQALAWTRQLHQEAKADQISGLHGWLRLWSPSLYTPAQLEALVQILALRVRVWRAAQALQRAHMRGDFTSYDRLLGQWKEHQRRLVSPAWNPYRAAIQGMVATPLEHQVHLKKAIPLHQLAMRQLRQASYKACYQTVERLRSHIKSLRAIPLIWRNRWLRQITSQVQSVGEDLRRRAKDMMRRKKWKKAIKLFDNYLDLLPNAFDGAAIRKQRARAKRILTPDGPDLY